MDNLDRLWEASKRSLRNGYSELGHRGIYVRLYDRLALLRELVWTKEEAPADELKEAYKKLLELVAKGLALLEKQTVVN